MSADIIQFPVRAQRIDPLQQVFDRLEAWRNRPREPHGLREWMQQQYPDSNREFDW